MNGIFEYLWISMLEFPFHPFLLLPGPTLAPSPACHLSFSHCLSYSSIASLYSPLFITPPSISFSIHYSSHIFFSFPFPSPLIASLNENIFLNLDTHPPASPPSPLSLRDQILLHSILRTSYFVTCVLQLTHQFLCEQDMDMKAYDLIYNRLGGGDG